MDGEFAAALVLFLGLGIGGGGEWLGVHDCEDCAGWFEDAHGELLTVFAEGGG